MGKAVSGKLSCTGTCLLLIHTQILEIDGLEKGTFVICCSIHFTLVLYPLSDKVCKGFIDFCHSIRSSLVGLFVSYFVHLSVCQLYDQICVKHLLIAHISVTTYQILFIPL